MDVCRIALLLLQVIDDTTAAVKAPIASTAAASGYLIALLSLLSRRTILPAFDRFIVRPEDSHLPPRRVIRANVSLMPRCSRLELLARPSKCAR